VLAKGLDRSWWSRKSRAHSALCLLGGLLLVEVLQQMYSTVGD
jgi:hypothetical protein